MEEILLQLDGNGRESGHVRVFNFNGNSWEKLGNDIDGESNKDISGWSISLSGDGSIVAIGAHLNDGNGIDSGHVRVYQNDGVTWTQLGDDIDGEAAEDGSGRSVSLSGDGSIVAIGALKMRAQEEKSPVMLGSTNTKEIPGIN